MEATLSCYKIIRGISKGLATKTILHSYLLIKITGERTSERGRVPEGDIFICSIILRINEMI